MTIRPVLTVLAGLAALALALPAAAQSGPGKLKKRGVPKSSKSSSSSSSSSSRKIVVENGKVVVDEKTVNGKKVRPDDDLARIVSSGTPEDCERFVREFMRRHGFPDAEIVVAKDSAESSSSDSSSSSSSSSSSGKDASTERGGSKGSGPKVSDATGGTSKGRTKKPAPRDYEPKKRDTGKKLRPRKSPKKQ